jgi:hypothetical protein
MAKDRLKTIKKNIYLGGNTMKRFALLFAAVCMWCYALPALAFNSGSTGADGAFSPPANIAVQLPDSGVLNYTTVNIPTGVTVTFLKNATNTPVYILASGDVTIAGTINVNGDTGATIAPGRGGPGGFDGGVGGPVNFCGGPGLGSGGGKAGIQVFTTMSYGAGGGGGSFGTAGAAGGTANATYSRGGAGGSTYGNTDIYPFIGGSGGGGACASSSYLGTGGGGGGGALLIASSGTINVTGSITANGGAGGAISGGSYSGVGGAGSGGAIRLVANTIKGEGTISATGGLGGGVYLVLSSAAAGSGRILFEANTFQRSATTNPPHFFDNTPATLFPAVAPSLKITKIGGITVTATPKGTFGDPDVTLPSTIVNPVDILVESSNIPVGTTVSITIIPEFGATTGASAVLQGSDALSTATVPANFSSKTVNVIVASATFTLASSNSVPVFADGERVAKIKVDSVLGGKSSITYITESGREVRASM